MLVHCIIAWFFKLVWGKNQFLFNFIQISVLCDSEIINIQEKD